MLAQKIGLPQRFDRFEDSNSSSSNDCAVFDVELQSRGTAFEWRLVLPQNYERLGNDNSNRNRNGYGNGFNAEL